MSHSMNLPRQVEPVRRTIPIQSSVGGAPEAPMSAFGMNASENAVVASDWIDDALRIGGGVAGIAAPLLGSLI